MSSSSSPAKNDATLRTVPSLALLARAFRRCTPSGAVPRARTWAAVPRIQTRRSRILERPSRRGVEPQGDRGIDEASVHPSLPLLRPGPRRGGRSVQLPGAVRQSPERRQRPSAERPLGRGGPRLDPPRLPQQELIVHRRPREELVDRPARVGRRRRLPRRGPSREEEPQQFRPDGVRVPSGASRDALRRLDVVLAEEGDQSPELGVERAQRGAPRGEGGVGPLPGVADAGAEVAVVRREGAEVVPSGGEEGGQEQAGALRRRGPLSSSFSSPCCCAGRSGGDDEQSPQCQRTSSRDATHRTFGGARRENGSPLAPVPPTPPPTPPTPPAPPSHPPASPGGKNVAPRPTRDEARRHASRAAASRSSQRQSSPRPPLPPRGAVRWRAHVMPATHGGPLGIGDGGSGNGATTASGGSSAASSVARAASRGGSRGGTSSWSSTRRPPRAAAMERVTRGLKSGPAPFPLFGGCSCVRLRFGLRLRPRLRSRSPSDSSPTPPPDEATGRGLGRGGRIALTLLRSSASPCSPVPPAPPAAPDDDGSTVWTDTPPRRRRGGGGPRPDRDEVHRRTERPAPHGRLPSIPSGLDGGEGVPEGVAGLEVGVEVATGVGGVVPAPVVVPVVPAPVVVPPGAVEAVPGIVRSVAAVAVAAAEDVLGGEEAPPPPPSSGSTSIAAIVVVIVVGSYKVVGIVGRSV
ncbi:hypothetical protein ACHAWF_014068, partial [Thalassiosira exigua]